MKKITLILALIMLLSLVGCSCKKTTGGTDTSASDSSAEVTTAAPEVPAATRQEMEEALRAVAFAYYVKGGRIQYDATTLETVYGIYYGGRSRIDEHASPELATSTRTMYSVCADFCYKVYEEALGYKLFGAADHCDATTKAMWLMCQKQQDSIRGDVESKDILLARYMSPTTYSSFTEEDTKFGLHKTEGVDMDFATFRTYLENYENNLRIGDIIVCGYKDTGHAMMYLGNGYMIECTGQSLDSTTWTDKAESDGALVIWTFEDFFLNGKRAGMWCSESNPSPRDWYIVIRPLDLLMKDENADPALDKAVAPYSVIPEKTKTRLAYACLDIDRKNTIGEYGTAVSGGTILYKVKVTNASNNEYYKKIYNTYGQTYEKLVITETIPEGCELVGMSISGNGLQEDGKITWVLDIEAGESAVVGYEVKVNIAAGGELVNGGGFVGAIPSNVLKNGVGKGTAADTSENYLKNFPDVTGLTLALFDSKNEKRNPQSVQRTEQRGGYYNILKADRSKVASSFTKYYDMVVDGFIGGRRTMVDGDYITQLRLDTLETGDVFVCVDTSATGSVLGETAVVYMYIGNNQFLKKASDGTISTDTAANAFAACYSHSLFYCLRQTQA